MSTILQQQLPRDQERQGVDDQEQPEDDRDDAYDGGDDTKCRGIEIVGELGRRDTEYADRIRYRGSRVEIVRQRPGSVRLDRAIETSNDLPADQVYRENLDFLASEKNVRKPMIIQYLS